MHTFQQCCMQSSLDKGRKLIQLLHAINIKCVQTARLHSDSNLGKDSFDSSVVEAAWAFHMLTAILVLLAAPFLFNHWSYVWNQYHEWIVTRTAENRQNWLIGKLPLDLWYILHWLCGLPIALTVYRLTQLGSAAVLASFCVIQHRKGWAIHRVLTGLLCLTSIWMTLCGPATESYTYVLLARR